MSFEKNLNTFKTSLLKAGGATSGKQYLVGVTKSFNYAKKSYEAYLATSNEAISAAHRKGITWDLIHLDPAVASSDDAFKNALINFDAAKQNVIDADPRPGSKSFFFKPYKSKLDFADRVSALCTAPVALSLLAVEQLFEFLVLGLKSIVDFARGGKLDIEKPIDAICSSIKLLLMAVVSPLLNTVDVIGSSIASGLNKPNDEVEDDPVLGLKSQ